MSGNAIKDLLLVEDCPGDVRLMEEAFRHTGADVRLHVAADGAEALEFVKQQGRHAGVPRPDLILLDLNLPGLDGREVLAQIKADDRLKSIPTVVLTASEEAGDVVESYKLANCYLQKPVGIEAYEALVTSINDFWLTRAALPQQRSTA